MTKTRGLWLGVLLFAAAAVAALGWYAWRTPGGGPLAMIGAAPLVILGGVAVRRLRAGR